MSLDDVRQWIARDFAAAAEKKKASVKPCAICGVNHLATEVDRKRTLQAPCVLCKGDHIMTKHHLIPYSMKWTTRRYESVTIPVCRACHTEIHRRFTNQQLAEEGDTLEKLRALLGK